MCSIFRLLPGYTLPYNMLYNVVHNNEHGYGIILKEKNRIQVIKELPNPVDPEKLHNLLKEHEDVERWVHLRNQTKGDISLDNVQPIQVYDSNKRQVYFMHNGTIYGTAIPKEHEALIDPSALDAKSSDSKVFALSKIAPILLRFKGEKGLADLEDPFLQSTLRNSWQAGNGRGVLISNDQPGLLLSPASWETIKDSEGKEFLASNNEYFSEVKRGTLFEKIKKEKEEASRKTFLLSPPKNDNTDSDVFLLKHPPFEKQMSYSNEVIDLLQEYDLYSEAGFIQLAYLEESELAPLFKEHWNDALTMFMFLTTFLREATLANQKLMDKLKKAELLIESLYKEKAVRANVAASV